MRLKIFFGLARNEFLSEIAFVEKTQLHCTRLGAAGCRSISQEKKKEKKKRLRCDRDEEGVRVAGLLFFTSETPHGATRNIKSSEC